MSKALKRKFGVKRIGRYNLDLICKECGKRAGLHHGSICPKIETKGLKMIERKEVRYETNGN